MLKAELPNDEADTRASQASEICENAVMNQYRSRRLKLVLTGVLALLLAAAGIVYAGASWSGVTGPSWNGTDWVLTANVTYTGGHKTTCISGTFPPAGTFGPIVCADPAPDGGAITCTIPGSSVANASNDVSWQLTGWTGSASCTGTDETGPSGTFAPNGTGSTAVKLVSFGAGRTRPMNGAAAAVVVVSTLLGAGVYGRRRKDPAV